MYTRFTAEVNPLFSDYTMCNAVRKKQGVRGAHLNSLGLFLRISIPFIWHILSAFLPACTPWLRGPVSPRCNARTGNDYSCVPEWNCHCSDSAGEKDAKLAQKLGQLQPFITAFAQQCTDQLASFGST